MRKVRKILAYHFDKGRSARSIAVRCGLSRRSVAQTLARFAASGLSWPEAGALDDAALEGALYRRSHAAQWPEVVDWAAVEQGLSGRGVTLLLWEEWREAHPDEMSYPTWCRRSRARRPRRDVTMRQNRRPGERLVDYAGMTAPVLIDGKEHQAQGLSGQVLTFADETRRGGRRHAPGDRFPSGLAGKRQNGRRLQDGVSCRFSPMLRTLPST